MKTENFKVTVDSKDKEFTVRSPTLNDQREAQKAYNQAFTDAIKSKAVVRAKLDDLLEEQGLWNQEKQAKFTELQQQILDGEKRLAKGGFNLKEAKNLALEMKKTREEIRDLISVRTSLDNHSAEGQADNARFNYLVSSCVVYKENNERYFKSLEDYLNRTDDPVALVGAQKLANMIYGLDNNFEKSLPENKFLQKFKFVDDKLRLINKEGRLVDIEGRLVDESGRYIDEAGNFVDKFGNKVDKDGDYIVDSQPFLDDDGNPVVLENETTPQPSVEAAEVKNSEETKTSVESTNGPESPASNS
jgi:hypothetical protein